MITYSGAAGPWVALLPIPVLSGVVCAGLIVILRPVLVRYAMARPNARSSHTTPTPQGAGIAVVLAIVAAAAVAGLLAATAGVTWRDGWINSPIFVLLAAAVGMASIGAADDLRPVAVGPRLLLQTVMVVIALTPFPAEWRVFNFLPLLVERALMLLAGLWFVNLVNFMDGLDWMTVAGILPMSLALAGFSLAGAAPAEVAIISLALAGALIGFAPFNRPVARLFLGDVGSLPIGLLIGWCLLGLAFRQHLAAAILLPMYYLADTTITLLRRGINREKFWVAHRSHFYQQATDRGFTVLQIVREVFALNVFLALLAGLSIWMTSAATDAGMIVLGACAVGFVLVRFSRSDALTKA